MNSNLSKEAAGLVEAGRSALLPGLGDKASVRHALEQQLALGGMMPPANGAAAKAGALWPKLVGVAAGIGASTAAVVLIWPAQPSVRPPAASTPSSVSPARLQSSTAIAPELAVTAPQPNEASAAAPSVGGARSSEPTPAGSTRAHSDRLREEVLLLTRAQKEFQAKRLNPALSLVDEHGRKFPRGALVQERVTLRSRVLCALGRVKEADAEHARLKHPQTGKEKSAPSGVCNNGTLAPK